MPRVTSQAREEPGWERSLRGLDYLLLLPLGSLRLPHTCLPGLDRLLSQLPSSSLGSGILTSDLPGKCGKLS